MSGAASLADSPTSSADTFALSATFQSGIRINGTIMVDQRSGKILHADLKTSQGNQVEFDRLRYQQSLGYAYIFCLAPSDAPWPVMIIGERDSPQTLVGYAGGPMGPRTDIVSEDGSADGIVSGTFTLVSSPKSTP